MTRLGIPGILILVVLGVCFGGDIFGGGGPLQVPIDVEAPPGTEGLDDAPDPDDELFAFMEFLEADIQNMWSGVFQQAGRGSGRRGTSPRPMSWPTNLATMCRTPPGS